MKIGTRNDDLSQVIEPKAAEYRSMVNPTLGEASSLNKQRTFILYSFYGLRPTKGSDYACKAIYNKTREAIGVDGM